MLQLKNAKFYLQAKLGQRGAEMVEYALVLACVCAVGAIYYAVSATPGEGVSSTLGKAVSDLWSSVGKSVGSGDGGALKN